MALNIQMNISVKSLQTYHTFSLPYHSEFLSTFSDETDFSRQYEKHSQTYILGGGSNTIFLANFAGKVLVNEIEGIEHTETKDAHYLRVGAGENWHALIKKCLANGWHGMENLALIPGSVGASPIQNIGAYGLEVKSFVDSVEYIELSSLKKCKISGGECQFDYRDSIFKHTLAGKVLITHVNFALPKKYKLETTYGELAKLIEPTPRKIFEQVVAIRKAKLPDPTKLGNAGSFFKNPVIPYKQFNLLKNQYPSIPSYTVGEGQTKIPAAWLIDQLGFKGKQIGGVQCHTSQPLVLVNKGEATGQDVVDLAQEIMTKVNKTFQIELEPEVRLVGEKGLINL